MAARRRCRWALVTVSGVSWAGVVGGEQVGGDACMPALRALRNIVWRLRNLFSVVGMARAWRGKKKKAWRTLIKVASGARSVSTSAGEGRRQHRRSLRARVDNGGDVET